MRCSLSVQRHVVTARVYVDALFGVHLGTTALTRSFARRRFIRATPDLLLPTTIAA